MSRIRRSEALCLRAADYRESSKLVTFFSPDAGRLLGIAKGARRLRSKFGAALEQFAVSRVLYYWHQERTVFTIADADLVRLFANLTSEWFRFLAAQQIAEFLLRSLRPLDANPRLYRLTVRYLEVLDGAERGFSPLVGSYLLKASSLLGFRPELRRCLFCRRPVAGFDRVSFDVDRGGVCCPECGAGRNPVELTRQALADLELLLYAPAARIAESPPAGNQVGLALDFVMRHLDPFVANSYNWAVQ